MKLIKISILKLFLLLLLISCSGGDNKFYHKIDSEEIVVTYKENMVNRKKHCICQRVAIPPCLSQTANRRWIQELIYARKATICIVRQSI